MRRANTHAAAGGWPEAEAADTVTLDFDSRHRRRILLATDSGAGFLLDLPEAIAMADGDGLRLDDGRWVRVCAAAEHLTEVRHEDPRQLMRLAWHLGNRHLPAEIRAGALFIRPDHVTEEMLRGHGATLSHVDAPFQPEDGVYGGHGYAGGHEHGAR
jgi:urease accessory protein